MSATEEKGSPIGLIQTKEATESAAKYNRDDFRKACVRAAVKRLQEQEWFTAEQLESALDLGCGSGEFARILTQFGIITVLGVDVSEQAVGEFNLRAKTANMDNRLRAIVCDIIHEENDEIRPSSFGLVTCVLSLHHLPTPFEYLYKLAKLVRPGGRLVIVDHVNDEYARR